MNGTTMGDQIGGTEFVDVEGGRIAYDVIGHGPLVVLAPGVAEQLEAQLADDASEAGEGAGEPDAANGDEAAPEAELRWIDEVRKKYYLDLADVPVPVSQANAASYGTSTMPTLVLIDKHGIVGIEHSREGIKDRKRIELRIYSDSPKGIGPKQNAKIRSGELVHRRERAS